MLTEIVLEIFKNLEWLTTDVIFTDYQSSYGNLRRYLRFGRPQRLKKEGRAGLEKGERQKFHNLLYQLKKQEFIEKKKDNGKKTVWRLTSEGQQRLKFLKSKKLLSPLKSSGEEKKDCQKIIVFDIPENQKKKRDWLRDTLTNFNFSMIQRSVWMGDSQLPEEFFYSLKELNLMPCIHIFAVNKEKTGTLESDR
ncbi:MAG: hypothetical protein AAB404_02270 [Patescibacteria group bacterium]